MKFTFTNMETGESVKISANRDYYGDLKAGAILKNKIPFKYSTVKDFKIVKNPVFYHDDNCIVQVISYEENKELEPPFFTTENITQMVKAAGAAGTLDIAIEECSELIKAITKFKRNALNPALCNNQSFNDIFNLNNQYVSETMDAMNLASDIFEEMADVTICVSMLKKLLEDSGWNLDVILEQKMERNAKRVRSGEFK